MYATSVAPKTTTGREYLRVSLAKNGKTRSIAEQHAEDVAAAVEYGITLVGDPDVDVGSASRFARKAREGYDRLIADLRAGQFGADLLVLWESSRGSRTVGEWVTLLELLEAGGHKVFVKTHGRIYDPSNPRDRRSLLEDAVDSEYETGKMSVRLRRAFAAAAAEGRPHGRVPFGYQRHYHPTTRMLVAQDIHPAEAEVIRELMRRLVHGHSLHSIAADFERRGIRSRKGVVFRAQHLRRLALNPLYIGRRVHDQGRFGGTPGPDAQTFEGAWPPLVDEQTFYAVQAILTAPERSKGRTGRAVHLLSRIARCAHCDSIIDGRFDEYRCHAGGCLRVRKAGVDQVAERLMLRALSREDVFADMLASTNSDDSSELTTVRTELARLRQQLSELADAVAACQVSPVLAGRSEAKLLASVRAAERRERELATPPMVRGLIDPGPTVGQQWKVAPLSTKREVAKVLFSPAMLGGLRLTKSPVPQQPVAAWQRMILVKEGQRVPVSDDSPLP